MGVNMEIMDANNEELQLGTEIESSAPIVDGSQKRVLPANIDLLMDVSMRVTVELGRTRMQLAQILELQHGSVVELDRLAGDPVDVIVNDCMVAHGEVVIVDDKFGVRITEMVSSKNGKASM
jgi:flagellar motor switch protein FliN